MTLKEQILEDIKHYMKEKDNVALNAVRMLKSDVKNAEIAAIKELDDEGVIKVVASSIKKRKDSAEIYIKNGRQDLADKELAEIKVLEKYLPAQLDDEAIKAVITEVIASLDDNMKKNFGAVMKNVMAKVGSSAEGKRVSELIKGML
ncbi:MAG: GatB/YqeY domain-containing protein [Mucispirillum sp.]|nr:GatB/YqeY domain-containing protein [Mucispirillum sp.]